LRQLVDGVRFIERMRSAPVDKDKASGELESLRRMFTKSVVTRVALPAGTVLEEAHLAAKKPGTGIPAARLSKLIGRRLRSRVEADHLLLESDLESCP
jgi:N-acetylneuraminate synthase